MTAELAILNRSAVVLAADSAVTLRAGKRTKVFNTANKLHLLVEDAPVGVMVYGSPDLVQVPWETIIKLYRQYRDGQVFQHLSEYADDLIEFIEERMVKIFPEEAQRRSIRIQVKSAFIGLREQIRNSIGAKSLRDGPVSPEWIQTHVDTKVSAIYEGLRESPFRKGWGKEEESRVLTEHKEDFEGIRDSVFYDLDLSRKTSLRLITIAVDLVVRQHREALASGVVVAGYGKGDLFPSLKEFHVQGVAMNRLLYVADRVIAIGYERSACVKAFAQADMAAVFMSGIDKGFAEFANWLIGRAFAALPEAIAAAVPEFPVNAREGLGEAIDEMASSIGRGMNQYQQANLVDPVLDTIELMPKEEMTQLAEALVNLTSMKRRATMEPETVGGPVDVAVISKGDGFVWVQRKHYFDPALNPRFISRYYRDAGTEVTLKAELMSSDREEEE